MPFTHQQFLDVFGAYNAAMWPAAVILWLASVTVMVAFYRRGATMTRSVMVLLAIHWLWSGVAYHLMYFRPINPAATLFAAMFVLQAGLLLRWRFRGSAFALTLGSSVWSRAGAALVAYSLLYPALGLLLGLSYPRLPLFAVPCPTTILTAGILLSAPVRDVRWLGAIPILWAGIGGSAALSLGIRADFALLVAGTLLIAMLVVRPRASTVTAA